MRLALLLTGLFLLSPMAGGLAAEPVKTLPAKSAAAPTAAPAAAPAVAVSDIAPLKAWQDKTQSHLEYIGARHGLDMWIATRNQSLQLIYTTPDRRAMVVDGTIIGLNGEDATADMQRAFVSAHPDLAENMLKFVAQNDPRFKDAAAGKPLSPDPAKPDAPLSKSERLWQDLSDAKTVAFGPATAPAAFMIVDLTCDHCKALWKKLQPQVEAGQLQLKLMPIAILGKSSQEAAANLLSHPDQPDGWLIHTGQAKGELPPTTADGKTALAANQALAVRYKLLSTPTLVYRSQATGKVKLVFGNPADMAGIWTDMGVQSAAPAPVPPAADTATP